MSNRAAKVKPPRVAILAHPDASASVVFGMFDLFASAGRDWGLVTTGRPGRAVLQPTILAASQEPFAAANDVVICPQRALADEPFDIVCVPELAVSPNVTVAGRYTQEADWLRRQHQAGAVVASACSGALLLAEAGLLDGYDATTHWAFCDALAQRYPKVKVHPERALVITGEGQRLVMAGGGTSYFDLALYLIARASDLETANQVARLNLIDWHSRGQQPYARLASARQNKDLVIAKCQEWIGQRPGVEAPVASMVRLSGLAERTFKRRFLDATGMTPLAYVHMVRLEEAKKQLESTDDPLALVAERAGYGDVTFFSRLFKRLVRMTPVEYRRRFGSLRKALEQSRT
ncbi:MAG: helix-turn-helix domain-containing protein [Deltaproteobacteria bacterium]|nr:helix-turn-helix domain-containing protein [Deltaproteobacteria bacterium]